MLANHAERETVRQGMHRMTFVVGRPTPMALACGHTDNWLSRNEREQLTVCITDMWADSLKYMKKLWSLRCSILAAPSAVQRQLSVNPATTVDVEGMLARAYSQRDRTTRTRTMMSKLARFCQVRHLPPASETKETDLHISFDEPAGIIHPGTAWHSSWIPWFHGQDRPQGYTPRSEHDEGEPKGHRLTSAATVVDDLVADVVANYNQISEADQTASYSGVSTNGPAMPIVDSDHTSGVAQAAPALALRRNPPRVARPPKGLDLDTWDFANTPGTACGLIPPDRALAVLAGEGAAIIRHPDDHSQLWIRRSEFCPNGGFGMFFAAPKGGLRAGYLLAVYIGESTDSLEISYREALARWTSSDYVFSDSDHRYVVNGALTCAAARANESFGETNAKLVFNSKERRAELRLGAPVQEGLYEGLVNYTAPHMPSPYWTEDKLDCLPLSTQKKARAFYSSNGTSSLK